MILTIGAVLGARILTGLRDELPESALRGRVPGRMGVFAGVSSVVASYTPRRAYAVAAIIALFIVPPIVVSIIAALSVPDVAEVLPWRARAMSSMASTARSTARSRSAGRRSDRDVAGPVHHAVTALGYIAGSLAIVVRRYLTVTG